MPVDPKYITWIEEFERKMVARTIGLDHLTPANQVMMSVRGMCQGACNEMLLVFPELKKVRGHYNGISHWWCVDPDGNIVDPTAKQFSPGGTYTEYHGPDPVGKCINCGEWVWTMEFSSSACSEECSKELEAEYNGHLR